MFKKSKVIIIGDLMLDHYLYGTVDRMCPEAPVPVLNCKSENLFLGGVGVVLTNLINLSLEPVLLTVVGEDKYTEEVYGLLKKESVNLDGIIQEKGRKNTKKTRFISTAPSWKLLLRYDEETTHSITEDSESKLIEKFKENIDQVEYILISDYNKGVLTSNLIKTVLTIANEKGKKVIVDSKGRIRDYKGAYIIAPNRNELFSAFEEEPSNDLDKIKEYAKKLSEETNSILMVKLSEKGVYSFDGNNEIQFPSIAKKVMNVSGAGDIFVVGLVAALSSGYSLSDSIKLANMGAGKAIEREKPHLKMSDFDE